VSITFFFGKGAFYFRYLTGREKRDRINGIMSLPALKTFKPEASRASSFETYIVGMGRR
jgi:23S rRNA U2552 (ribose-2'-O)-methylase RlmE/FtsJ